MSNNAESQVRAVKAVYGLKKFKPDAEFEIGLAEHLRHQYRLLSVLRCWR